MKIVFSIFCHRKQHLINQNQVFYFIFYFGDSEIFCQYFVKYSRDLCNKFKQTFDILQVIVHTNKIFNRVLHELLQYCFIRGWAFRDSKEKRKKRHVKLWQWINLESWPWGDIWRHSCWLQECSAHTELNRGQYPF